MLRNLGVKFRAKTQSCAKTQSRFVRYHLTGASNGIMLRATFRRSAAALDAQKMFAIIVIALLVLLAAAFSLYIRHAAQTNKPGHREFSRPSFEGLFPASSVVSESAESVADTTAYRKAKLVDRARGGELETLYDANQSGDQELYQDVLEALIESAPNDHERFHALVARITGSNDLRGNRRLAERVIEEWKKNPSIVSTGEMVHVAALSDDVAIYAQAVDLVVSSWKAGQLSPLSAEQVFELVESQYWLLAHEARHGGEGFALKMKLFKLGRELAKPAPAS